MVEPYAGLAVYLDLRPVYVHGIGRTRGYLARYLVQSDCDQFVQAVEVYGLEDAVRAIKNSDCVSGYVGLVFTRMNLVCRSSRKQRGEEAVGRNNSQ